MPLLYEIHTRAWLRELSERTGHPVTIANVPDAEIEKWDELGFSDIWLMGVWKIGEGARAKALEHWHADWRNEIPSGESDVHGSPYAIEDYVLDPAIGTVEEFFAFKKRVNQRGMGIILDFVPNHFSLDSPAAAQFPSYFVQGHPGLPGTFTRKTKFGKKTFAHGKDPNFPPWTDTIQVEHRNGVARHAIQSLARARASMCDGFRCDMAMLVLEDVFEKTWRGFPLSVQEPARRGTFWSDLWKSISVEHPYFISIAEVYWDMEERLQGQGFDFTYHKPVYDLLVRGEAVELADFLRGKKREFLSRCVHFLENHDEPRIASLLPWEKHKLAAFLVLTIPGVGFLHEGQLEGRKAFARIQMSKRAAEEPDPEIAKFYRELLHARKRSAIFGGSGVVVEPIGLKEMGTNTEGLVITLWEDKDGLRDLALVNLGSKLARGFLALEVPDECTPEVIFSTDPKADCGVHLLDGKAAVELSGNTGQIIRLAGKRE